MILFVVLDSTPPTVGGPLTVWFYEELTWYMLIADKGPCDRGGGVMATTPMSRWGVESCRRQTGAQGSLETLWFSSFGADPGQQPTAALSTATEVPPECSPPETLPPVTVAGPVTGPLS